MTGWTSRLRQYALVLIAAFGLVLGVAGVAQAFTYAPANGVSPDGSANLTDPDEQFSSGNNGSTLKLPGGTSLQFGTRDSRDSADRDYNAGVNRMFNPLGRPGESDSR